MKYAYDELTGEVWLNRAASGDNEKDGKCTAQDLVWGMDNDKYKVVGGVFAPVSESESEEIEAKILAENEILNLAAIRFELETEDFEFGGVTYSMAREDRNVMFQTITYIKSGLIPSARWKAKSGWVTLDSSNVDNLQAAIIEKVQDAFIWEETQRALLEVE